MPNIILPRAEPFNFALLCGFIILIFLTGGGSDPSVQSLVVVRLAAILVLAVAAVQIGRAEFRRVAPIMLGLAAFAAIVAIQLIPLPPSIWTGLPGREQFVQDLAAAGIAPDWHSLSLTPDGTLNTLLALLTPLAVIAILSLVDRSRLPHLFWLLLGGIAASALLGVVQIATGRFYTFEVTNLNSAVGLLANRSHQALLLAIAFPLLAAWVRVSPNRRAYRVRGAIALMSALFLIPLILVTGSRAGLLAGIAAAILALVIVLHEKSGERRVAKAKRLWAISGIAIVAAAAVALTLYLQRAESIDRVFSDQGAELRTENLPLFFEMVKTYFPFGSGFGSFAWLYQIDEPYELLQPPYFNHAHNDLIQPLIEGGLPMAILMIVFTVSFSLRSLMIVRKFFSRQSREDSLPILGVASVISILLIIGVSLTVYPTRTPLFAALAILFLHVVYEASRPTTAPAKTRLGSVDDLG